MDEQYNPTNPPMEQSQENLESAPSPEPPRKSGMGPLAGIVIIIILLVFGGLYFWGAKLNKQAQNDESALFDTTMNDDIAPNSDEPAQIENDLDDFDITDFEAQLEADLEAIEAGL